MKIKWIATAGVLLASMAPAMAQAPGGFDLGGYIRGADANKDGVVTKAEFETMRAAAFDAADKNKDGFLVGDEIPRPPGMAAGGPPPGPPPGAGAPPPGARRGPIADTNGDGKISKAEFLSDGGLFDAFDANKDGKIDQAELAAPPPPRAPGG